MWIITLKFYIKRWKFYLLWPISTTISTRRTTISHPKSFGIKKTPTYYVGNLSPCLGQAQKCGRDTLINDIPTLPLFDNWISNSNTDQNTQKTTYYHKNCVEFSKISPINTLILYINVYAYAVNEHRLNSNGLHIYHPTICSHQITPLKEYKHIFHAIFFQIIVIKEASFQRRWILAHN
jgi:hypothetical protein